MKKLKIIFPIIICIVIGLVSAYFIYGSTLVDITSEKSISDHMAIDPENPITILKTAQAGDCFCVLYTDPLDEDYDYSFRYITKSPFYKNRYYNMGGSSNLNGSEMLNFVERKSPDEKENKTAVFIHYLGKDKYKYNKCSVFIYNAQDYNIDFEKVTNDEEIREIIKKHADSYKKIDEVELPDDNIFIINKTYNYSYPYDIMVYDGSVTEENIKQEITNELDGAISEYHDYLKGKNSE